MFHVTPKEESVKIVLLTTHEVIYDADPISLRLQVKSETIIARNLLATKTNYFTFASKSELADKISRKRTRGREPIYRWLSVDQ